MALALVACAGTRAHAQVSPGRLSRAHAELEGNAHCFDCHEKGKGTTDAKCLACHREIRSLVDGERGLHGHEAKSGCAKCHPDHAGEGFALVDWGKAGREAFDHTRAAYPLDGKHAGRKCEDCHRPDRQVSPVMELLQRRDRAASLLGLERECRSCHKDPHEGRLGATCATCHVTKGWREVPKESFAHEKTRYPLLGLHARVTCEKCHGADPTYNARPVFAACNSCHRDPHAAESPSGRKTSACESCHTVDGFAPSTYTVARHEGAAYPLAGAHRRVKCASCHRTAPAPGDSLGGRPGAVVLRPRHDRCTSCHEKAHGAQLEARTDHGACESCHRVDAWQPSTFATTEHLATGFGLEGKHLTAKCAACHGPKREGLPPLPGVELLGQARVDLDLKAMKCADCHQDSHQGRYVEAAPALAGAPPVTLGGMGVEAFAGNRTGINAPCVACHGYDTFARSRIDLPTHARLGFVLEGSHRAVPCFGCHPELERRKLRSSLVAATERVAALPFAAHRTLCAQCHESPHGAQFASRAAGDACDKCHDQDRFRPASRFAHDRDSGFSLAGAHVKVACAKCHPTIVAAGGKPAVLYRPVAKECRACHAGAIGDSLGTGLGLGSGH